MRWWRAATQNNGTTFRPVGKKDGRIDAKLRLDPRAVKAVNQAFRGKWINGVNIGQAEAALIELWNADHPDDPVTTNEMTAPA